MAEENKFTVSIDGISVSVDPGTTILNAARQIGGDIVPPAMCYYSKLEGSGGKCRTCLVKVSKGSEKDPRPMPKLVASCRTTVMDGMEVQNITSPEVVEARKAVVEMLLINHPLDCPVCDQAGECKLQDLGYEHGSAKTRYEFERRTFERIDIGDKIQLHMNRCILCYRCVFTADQITDKRVHGVIGRGDHAEISTYIQGVVDNDFSGNVIDVCPVGALTDKTFRFKSRVWFTKPVQAHCACEKCSGKVTLWYKGEEVIRVTARKDEFGEVESFICNTCRFERKATSDWTIEQPTAINPASVIGANHYEQFQPPAVISEDEKLQTANRAQLLRTEKLK
ncbi:(2Fe-2S)-binding protein [Sphingobacteriaceae bacterium WQ 2009]|uniref:(2Fe-2S)-binding protein n=1 Tax=Rhinopithecimicrobium faecis TaxID=2820698 RepID=A0A8T4H9M0_9SPHI|nr:(2Fe-2S)-binding protein [Sphingobacteriaceae bacterium WQ 2009]